MIGEGGLVFSSTVAKTTGEGDRPGNTGWWRGRAPSTEFAARPLHHSLCGERSPSPMLCGMGEERMA